MNRIIKNIALWLVIFLMALLLFNILKKQESTHTPISGETGTNINKTGLPDQVG